MGVVSSSCLRGCGRLSSNAVIGDLSWIRTVVVLLIPSRAGASTLCTSSNASSRPLCRKITLHRCRLHGWIAVSIHGYTIFPLYLVPLSPACFFYNHLLGANEAASTSAMLNGKAFIPRDFVSDIVVVSMIVTTNKMHSDPTCGERLQHATRPPHPWRSKHFRTHSAGRLRGSSISSFMLIINPQATMQDGESQHTERVCTLRRESPCTTSGSHAHRHARNHSRPSGALAKRRQT